MTDAAPAHIIDIASLPADGASFLIEPGDAERQGIAARIEIPALARLSGAFRLTPFPGGVDVRLRLLASAARQCVVSLEPMTEEIDETILMRFERAFADDAAIDDDDILREPLDGDTVDLGELLVQHLSLSLDPYPRKDGANRLLDQYRSAASPSPFAVLKDIPRRDD